MNFILKPLFNSLKDENMVLLKELNKLIIINMVQR